MHPDPGEIAAGIGAAALRDLVFMVREHQVVAAAVDIETVAQQFAGHGGAFDMPAGATAPPRAVPAGLIGGGGLPQHEIHRIAFIGRDLDPGTRDHVIDGAARQPPIGGVAFDGKQHMALGGIGMTARDQGFDHRDHGGDVIGRAGHGVRLQRADGGHVIEIPLGRLAGDLGDIAARFLCPRDDLIVHIGEVAHIGHGIGAIDVAQQAIERVEHHHGAGIAQMRAVINGRPADIHRHRAGADGDERLLTLARRVPKPDLGHVRSSRVARRD